MEEVKKYKAHLQSVVKDWIKLMNSQIGPTLKRPQRLLWSFYILFTYDIMKHP
jgi:hypothetical protein